MNKASYRVTYFTVLSFFVKDDRTCYLYDLKLKVRNLILLLKETDLKHRGMKLKFKALPPPPTSALSLKT